MDALVTLAIAVVTALVNGAVTVALLRQELRQHGREITRAHKRLDAIDAPNVTLDEA